MKTNPTIILVALGMSVFGCNRFVQEATRQASNVGANNSVPAQLKVAMIVKNGSTVLLDTSNGSKNTIVAPVSAGASLSYQAKALNAPSGSSMQIKVVNTFKPDGVVAQANGSNGSVSVSFVAQDPGVYMATVSVKAQDGSEAAASYTGNVLCTNPTFTANSLSPSALSATGTYGKVSYNASGVVTNANGQAPYRCAFDFNGDGIADSALLPCNQAQGNKLSSYVESRKISVIVTDACNTSHSVSKSIVLPKSAPSNQDVFIAGVTSAASGCADDIRTKNVSYLGHNTAGKNICDPKYGNGSFSIECAQNYGLAHSKNFGMKVSVTGLGVYDIKTNSGTIDASNAKVSGISYFTDEGGDSAPRLSFSSSNCVSTVNAQVLNVETGTCSSGTGTNNSATINVWGTYTCSNVANACGSMTVTGSFAGLYNMNDGCVGGGQGGGGDPDPNF